MLKKVFILCTGFIFLFAGCEKRYICRCTGYEGLTSVERYRFRSESTEHEITTCDSYEQGSVSDGTQCELE